MQEGTTAWQVVLIGAASVGGLMAGTCLAMRRAVGTNRARGALVLGYMVSGVTFGAIGVACGVYIPALDVQSIREALILGTVFGGAGSAVMIAANIGSIVTLRYLGLTVTIEPSEKKDQSDD